MAKKTKKKDKGKGGLSDALAGIEARLGAGTIMNLEEGLEGVEFITTGSIAFDAALGGGWAKGRIVEIYGPESSGKTTACIHAMVEAQVEGGVAAMIDVENAFDPDYAEALGLDLGKDKFIVSQPESGEDAFTVLEALIDTGEISIAVVDSVAVLVPRAEIEGDFGESKMGLHARLMSQALRKLAGKIKHSDCIVIFINQTRDKIGVMFGSPETTTGGNALKFYASQRVRISKCGQIKGQKGSEEVTAVRTRVEVKKNKVAPPFRKAEFDIKLGFGIDKAKEMLEAAVDLEIVKKSGSWYSYEGSKLGQGAEAVLEILEDNEELMDDISSKVKEDLGL